MPIHDWTRVPSGLFHHFHQVWSVELSRALNRGCLPRGLSALVEQRSGDREPDVLAIEEKDSSSNWMSDTAGGTAVLERPKTKIIRQADADHYAGKANRVVIRHRLGRIVAFIEIVSPGNKDSTNSIQQFVEKVVAAMRQKIHVLVVDLFPPTRRDPFGIHKAIWDEIKTERFDLTNADDRVLASYESDGVFTAFVETVSVGDALPNMPLFIAPSIHVPVPLESTYAAAWEGTPDSVQRLVASPTAPSAS